MAVNCGKLRRELQNEDFEENLFPMLQARFGAAIFYDEKKSCYTIKLSDFEEKNSIIYDFYPKANKVLIGHKNQWIRGGRRWLESNQALRVY